MCEKPLTISVPQAQELIEIAKRNKTLLAVNYSYAGYPMIEQARCMVENGSLGEIIKIASEYRQDNEITDGGSSMSWHDDPAIAGASGCTANIGTHIDHLVSYITGLTIDRLTAVFTRMPPDRQMESDFSALIQYSNGAYGTMWGCKTAIGEDCNINLRIYGTKGSLEWSHLQPQNLKVAWLDQPIQIYTAGRSYLEPQALQYHRVSKGQIEGYCEATANIYAEFMRHIVDRKNGREKGRYYYPSAYSGFHGVAFVQACLESVQKGGAWVYPHHLGEKV